MKYVDDFRSVKLIQRALKAIWRIAPERQINLMEVCGTHTQSFFRFGLRKKLPQSINLISGPGCPVCVSEQGYIDAAISLCCRKGIHLLTFGDMLRVPGSNSTLEREKAKYGNVSVVYSPLDSLREARMRPDKNIVFLAVGFETTAPAIALAILNAKKEKLNNLYFLSSLKTIPPAMEYLAKDPRLKLDGFLCPGHVSAIIGSAAYGPLVKKYGIGCCVAGFEPLDILEGIYLLLQQVIQGRPKVENQYARVVSKPGNKKALGIIHQVFKVTDASWRSLGVIPKSGLQIRDEFGHFDAARQFSPGRKLASPAPALKKCKCAEILKGILRPPGCPLFLKVCTPDNPVGPCMVTNEGACNAYYKYQKA